jgi:hypothetical protein
MTAYYRERNRTEASINEISVKKKQSLFHGPSSIKKMISETKPFPTILEPYADSLPTPRDPSSCSFPKRPHECFKIAWTDANSYPKSFHTIIDVGFHPSTIQQLDNHSIA